MDTAAVVQASERIGHYRVYLGSFQLDSRGKFKPTDGELALMDDITRIAARFSLLEDWIYDKATSRVYVFVKGGVREKRPNLSKMVFGDLNPSDTEDYKGRVKAVLGRPGRDHVWMQEINLPYVCKGGVEESTCDICGEPIGDAVYLTWRGQTQFRHKDGCSDYDEYEAYLKNAPAPFGGKPTAMKLPPMKAKAA